MFYGYALWPFVLVTLFCCLRACLFLYFCVVGLLVRWFVFHLAVLDSMSSCNCLSVCLEEIKAWSDVHLAHHILFIEIELKIYGDFLRVRALVDSRCIPSFQVEWSIMPGSSLTKLYVCSTAVDGPALRAAMHANEAHNLLECGCWCMLVYTG